MRSSNHRIGDLLLITTLCFLYNGVVCANSILRNALPPPDYSGPRLTASNGTFRRTNGDHSADSHNYYHGTFQSLELARSSILTVSGASVVGRIGELDDTYLFAIPIGHPAVATVDTSIAASQRTVSSSSNSGVPWKPLIRKSWTTKKILNDPGFSKQYHLYNASGPSMNASAAWNMGIDGTGRIVAILDNGLDTNSSDLKPNFYAAGSYDFVAQVADPSPKNAQDTHGTRCAGLAAASANTSCGVGVAYNAQVAGVRVLGGDLTAAGMAAALNYKYQNNEVFSCSWGPSDDGKTVEDVDSLSLAAMKNGVMKGRGGRGSIFVFASGNGGYSYDSCGYDGVSSNIYAMSVAAIGKSDIVAPFGERCAAIFVSSYGVDTYTTDVSNACYSSFSGTSAATPIVSGSVALLLQLRPELTWRDVHDVYRKAAVPVGLNASTSNWETLPSGLLYSDAYGYGKVDLGSIMRVAPAHQLLGDYTSKTFPAVSVNADMVYNVPLQSNYTVALGFPLKVERVSATVSLKHSYRGYLKIMLISPNNITSVLAYPRALDSSSDGLDQFTFNSVKHWGEAANGTWTLSILSTVSSNFTGNLASWNLMVHGEGTDPLAEASVNNPESLPASTIAVIISVGVAFISIAMYSIFKYCRKSGAPIQDQYSKQQMSSTALLNR